MRILQVFLSVFVCSLSFGQQNTVATGGIASGSGGNATFTVGQIDYSNANGTTGSINEGVQQPFEFFKEVGLQENDISIELFPNPTEDGVFITSDKLTQFDRIDMYDSRGRLVISHKIISDSEEIDLNHLEAGTYHLNFFGQNELQQTYKLIKR